MTEIRKGIRVFEISSPELTENSIDPETVNVEVDVETKESRTRMKIEMCPPHGPIISLYSVRTSSTSS